MDDLEEYPTRSFPGRAAAWVVATAAILCLIMAINMSSRLIGQAKQRPAGPPAATCPFCRDVTLKQVFYEGELVRAMLNYNPIAEGHALIIPRRHVERVENLRPNEVFALHQTVKKVQTAFKELYGTEDFVLATQNGAMAGQTVFHAHYHMIPRAEYNGFQKAGLWIHLLTRMLRRGQTLSDAELADAVHNLQNSMVN